jgi:hypothetical protein
MTLDGKVGEERVYFIGVSLPKTLSGLFLRRLWSLLIGLRPSRITTV